MTPARGDSPDAYMRMMERVGFYHDGEPALGVIPVATLRDTAIDQQVDKRIKYSAVIDPTQE